MYIREKDIDFILNKEWTLDELFNTLDYGFKIKTGVYEYDWNCRFVRMVYGDWEFTGKFYDNTVTFTGVQNISESCRTEDGKYFYRDDKVVEAVR